MTRDISSRAVRVNTIECPPPGTLIQMAITLTQGHGRRHGVTLHGEGVVVSVEGDDRSPSYGCSAGFAASVQFYPEVQSGPDKSDEVLSKAAANPNVN